VPVALSWMRGPVGAGGREGGAPTPSGITLHSIVSSSTQVYLRAGGAAKCRNLKFASLKGTKTAIGDLSQRYVELQYDVGIVLLMLGAKNTAKRVGGGGRTRRTRCLGLRAACALSRSMSPPPRGPAAPAAGRLHHLQIPSQPRFALSAAHSSLEVLMHSTAPDKHSLGIRAPRLHRPAEALLTQTALMQAANATVRGTAPWCAWPAQHKVTRMQVVQASPVVCVPALRTVKATSLPSSLQEGKLMYCPAGAPLTISCCPGGTGIVVSSVTWTAFLVPLSRVHKNSQRSG